MSASSLRLSNNGISTLPAGASSGATAITVVAGDGDKFPALSAGQYFMATLVQSGGALEIVKVTARAGDVLTITRAQEGTTALAFLAGDRIEHRLTAGTVMDELARTDADINSIKENYQTRSEKNSPDGYAGLDSSGLVPSSLLQPLIMQPNRIDKDLTIPDGYNAFFIDPVEFGPNVTVTGLGNSTLRGV